MVFGSPVGWSMRFRRGRYGKPVGLPHQSRAGSGMRVAAGSLEPLRTRISVTSDGTPTRTGAVNVAAEPGRKIHRDLR